MPRFKITPQAKDDLKSIGRYTLETWGRDQRDKYLKSGFLKLLAVQLNKDLE